MVADERRRTKDEGQTFNPQSSIFNLGNPWFQLALILAVAAFFRLWQIGSIPPGLFGDEAAEGLDALDVLAGRGQAFFPSNYGREGLYIWLVALSLKLFGVTPLAVRLPAIVIGILTCAVAWWLAREWGSVDWKQGRWVDQEPGLPSANLPTHQPTHQPTYQFTHLQTYLPLLTGLYLATAYWHVHFSRFSQRTVLTPFAIGLATAAFWRGLNLGRTRWFVAAGAFMGLALHTYSVGRFFPVFMAVFLGLQWLVTPKPGPGAPEQRILARHWRPILLMFLVAALVFAPLGVYFLTHPGTFMMRASAVATYAGAGPLESLKTIGRAALANLAQYVVPGAGDKAQFHNLPGRPVFDLLTAFLAIIGLLLCVRRWRQPAALFLLIWLVVLTAPAALATDRFPTLPRVLGVLPGLYLLPALGLSALISLLEPATSAVESQAAPHRRVTLSPDHLVLLCALALSVAAATTYRDYFRVWGPSAATFDAFEGDMTSAWKWLAAHEPAGHVYLSSDLYRHPTFMLLGERATVTEYFELADPNLSWFDARGALPLSPAGQPATYLIGASAALPGLGSQLLPGFAARERVLDPAGQPALTVLTLPADQAPTAPGSLPAPIVFSDRLTLTGAGWTRAADGAALLLLAWRTAGPERADWGGYRLEAAAGEQMVNVPFDSFRATEWVADGRFITWHRLELPDTPADVRLRLLRAEDGQPLVQPAAADGWHAVPLPAGG